MSSFELINQNKYFIRLLLKDMVDRFVHTQTCNVFITLKSIYADVVNLNTNYVLINFIIANT